MFSLPDGAGGEHLLGLGVDDGAHALAADLDDAVGRASGFNHLRPVGVQMDHGLFAVDVFAGLHGIDRNLFMPVVGRADDDGVDVFAFQDFAVVAGGEEVCAPEFLAVLEPAVVTVRNRDQFDAGNVHGIFGVALALAAGSDEGDLDVIVGCDWFRGFGLGLGQQMSS